MREEQRVKGLKPRYDGTWRPEPGKALPMPPTGVQPVIRFRNPAHRRRRLDDLVKGRIEIANANSTTIIARQDGTPTILLCRGGRLGHEDHH